MALSATALSADMKAALDAAFGALSGADDANRQKTCDALAGVVVDHIKAHAAVSTNVTGTTADGKAVTGTGTGTIS